MPPGSQWGAEQTLQLFELAARHGEYLYTRTTGFVDNVTSTCGSLEGAHGVRRLITEVTGQVLLEEPSPDQRGVLKLSKLENYCGLLGLSELMHFMYYGYYYV